MLHQNDSRSSYSGRLRKEIVMNQLRVLLLGVSYARHDRIRLLFDETLARLKKSRGVGFHERQIFVEVLGDTPKTREVFLGFLKDVSTCPEEIILWCQMQLNTQTK